MIQLELFPTQIKSTCLFAPESPKKAFYRIRLEASNGGYLVAKESGIKQTVLDRRKWRFDDLNAAEKFFEAKVKNKTDQNRKSPRKYVQQF